MLAARIRKRFRVLSRRFERQNIGAFRIYDWDVPEIRALVDWYDGHVVIAEYARQQTALPGYLEGLGRAVGDALGLAPSKVHLRQRRTGAPQARKYQRLAQGQERHSVRERDLAFWVSLDDSLDTGLFADHRITRRLVRAESADARFLNLFGYTGSFTCNAAAGGALSTTTVDLSGRYLNVARDNLMLNGLWGPRHTLHRGDVWRFLGRAARVKQSWTLGVLDPPSRSTRGPRGAFDVQTHHLELIELTLAVIERGGVLYFSTNHQRFAPQLDELKTGQAHEITAKTVPEEYRNRHVHRCWRIEKSTDR
jgi:23S rRNA G2069 N7-methylase RlmK/C1962 C5-methylase RlmI